MTTRQFGTFTAARSNLRDLFDTAHSGRVTTVARDRERFAVVDAGLLRAQLAALRPSGAVVVAEGGGWAAFLPGLPIAGDGADLDGALEDLIDAPNHHDNWSLVALTELSTDDQLKDWLLHDDKPVTR